MQTDTTIFEFYDFLLCMIFEFSILRRDRTDKQLHVNKNIHVIQLVRTEQFKLKLVWFHLYLQQLHAIEEFDDLKHKNAQLETPNKIIK